MITTFHKNYLKKLILILSPINSILPIAKLTTKPMAKPLNIAKRKHDQPPKTSIKQIKNV